MGLVKNLADYAWEQSGDGTTSTPELFAAGFNEVIKLLYNDDRSIVEILLELARARELHHDFPSDIIHQVAILSEETGEAIQAANNYVHDGDSLDLLREEVIHTGAMALRVLQNLDKIN